MRVIVVGGHGFIGRHVATALRGAGHAVQVAGRTDPVAGEAEALVFAQGTRAPDAERLAAEHVQAPAAWRAAVRPAHMVYLSSGEVYGDAPVPFCEEGPLLGASPYARAKRAGEEATLAAGGTVLRPAVVYGPGQTGTMLIPALLAHLAAGEVLPMTAGTQTRDFVHVKDLARLVVAALGHPGVFNAGTGVERAVADVALDLWRTFQARFGPRPPPGLGQRPERPHEHARYALDPSRAAAALGWRPVVSLSEGLADLVARAGAE